MNRWRLAVALIALSLLMILLWQWDGAAVVWQSLQSVSWAVLLIAAIHLPAVLADSESWRLLIPRSASRPGLWQSFSLRWMAESVNALLPVLQVGGELVRVRLARQLGVTAVPAIAATVVDIVTGALAQLAGISLGLCLILAVGIDSGLEPVVLLIPPILLIFVWWLIANGTMQVLLERLELPLVKLQFNSVAAGLSKVGDAVSILLSDRHRFLVALLGRSIGWLLGIAEIWLILWLLDIPVSLTDALMLEAATQLARSLGFFIPGAIGIQEGGLLLAGVALGLTPEASVSLSLLKRCRELLLGVPGILAWQWLEWKSLDKISRSA